MPAKNLGVGDVTVQGRKHFNHQIVRALHCSGKSAEAVMQQTCEAGSLTNHNTTMNNWRIILFCF